ncbi:unnamed protein product [Arctogadus glacialis]
MTPLQWLLQLPSDPTCKTPAFLLIAAELTRTGDTKTLDETQAVCGGPVQPVTPPPPAAYLNRRLTHDEAEPTAYETPTAGCESN